MIRVLLADDHIVVSEGLAAILGSEFDLVGVVHDGLALVNLAFQVTPDVVIADISMPGMNGLDASREILTKRPNTKIILLTMHSEPDLAARAFRAGIHGFVHKSSPAEELIDAVHAVMKHRQYLSPPVSNPAAKTMDHQNRVEASLTLRQKEILKLIGEGLTMRQAANKLFISPRTAESHKYEIMRQLGVDTTAQLVRHAVHLGLVEPIGETHTYA